MTKQVAAQIKSAFKSHIFHDIDSNNKEQFPKVKMGSSAQLIACHFWSTNLDQCSVETEGHLRRPVLLDSALSTGVGCPCPRQTGYSRATHMLRCVFKLLFHSVYKTRGLLTLVLPMCNVHVGDTVGPQKRIISNGNTEAGGSYQRLTQHNSIMNAFTQRQAYRGH